MPYKKNKIICIGIVICLLLTFLATHVFADQKHEASFDDLSEYFSTKISCKVDDEGCTERAEYKFYLKMYDIYYLYKNKYKVSLDLPLIMATLFYNSDQMSDVMEMNVSDYNHESLVKSNWNPKNVTSLDWEFNYERLPNYLVYNDSSYDMQILAKNMVLRTQEQSCVDKDGKKTKTEKVKDTEEDLKCEEGEKLEKGISTYKLDYDKYDDFLLKYIEHKYYIRKMVDVSCIPGKTNSRATNTSNEVAGNIIIGDSRTVGMCMSIYGKTQEECTLSSGGGLQVEDDYIIAEGNTGSDWLKSTAIPAVNEYLEKNKDKKYNIISYMGINGLDIKNYIDIYSEIINGDWKDHNIVLVSVNPVNEEIESDHGFSAKNSDIEEFNNKLSKDVSSDNTLYCDTYSEIKDSISTIDGLHYEKDTYKDIYELTNACISDRDYAKNSYNCKSSKIGGFKDGDIVYYNQCDYPNASYGGLGGLCEYGCGPSSLAIVISSLTGEEHDPVEMTDHVCSIGGCTYAGTTLDAIGQTIEDYGFHYTKTTDIQEVYDALANGDALVIASMGPGHFTANGHYITLTAAKGGDMIMVHDPGHRENNHEWDMNIVGTETNYGFWIVTR